MKFTGSDSVETFLPGLIDIAIALSSRVPTCILLIYCICFPLLD